MTSRNEVQIDIEVEGGARAERQFNRAEKGARGLGRSTRGLINPLLGAGLVAGILGGRVALPGAQSSGSASNSNIPDSGRTGGAGRHHLPQGRAGHRLHRHPVREAAHRCAARGDRRGHHPGHRLGCGHRQRRRGRRSCRPGLWLRHSLRPTYRRHHRAIASTFAAITGVVGPLLALP